MEKTGPIRIGVAGWNIPAPHKVSFGCHGSHLERYSARLPAVEINSSFYRPHRPGTYERWAASVPPAFRFSVKVPRDITHFRKLVDTSEPLEKFLAEVENLGEKLGPLVVQLPPSLTYNEGRTARFFEMFRNRFPGLIACEPRHESWFTDAVDRVLVSFRVARIAADPACVPRASTCGGWSQLTYRRLHGSPRTYYSAYSEACLAVVAGSLGRNTGALEQWCIFDNTALGEATGNALDLVSRV